MQEHLDQAKHNQDFHDCIETNFSGKFYDWKITVLFYVAIHGLKALAAKRGIDIGDTHQEIDRNVNPDRPTPVMRISKTAWLNYKNLYEYSRSARYDGITDFVTWQSLKQADYGHCVELLRQFKAYIKSQGVDMGA